MTFRPSDDVLDEIESGQNTSFSVSQNTVWGSENWWEYFFSSSENSNSWTNGELENNWSSMIYDLPVEEVKAPDLLDLLKDDWDDLGSIEEQPKIEMENMVSNDLSDLNENLWSDLVVNLDSQVENPNIENRIQLIEMSDDIVGDEINDNKEEIQQDAWIDWDSWKITDAHRQEIALSVEWSVSSNLDFLVDDNWLWFVNIYKTISRLLFRWWAVFFAIVCGVAGWTFLQIKDVYSDGVKMFNDGMIRNKSLWIEETSDKKLSELNDEGIDVNVIIPYWSAVLDNHSFESKSNLISYKWIVLPQLAFIRYDSDESIFWESFDEWNTTREDIEKLIKYLILDDAVYKKSGALPNASDIRWSANMFQGWLINGFNLWCLYSDKVSDIVCDRFLDIFNKYGKYFDLSVYASEISSLVKEMEKHSKDIEPVCSMIKDYTLRSGESSDILMSLMEDCGAYDYMFYRKLVNFIDLEKSLEQPQLADKVFDDPDLNAYKLLSAWQNVYKILEGTSINEGYIKSYLSYVQSLLNKDKGTGRYLQPIYRDLLYVFNMDQLYQKLIKVKIIIGNKDTNRSDK